MNQKFHQIWIMMAKIVSEMGARVAMAWQQCCYRQRQGEDARLIKDPGTPTGGSGD